MLALVLAGQTHILTASATPTAPVLLVNHTLKQCIDNVILSDECHVCQPVEDWEVSLTGQCPSGYKTISFQSIADKYQSVSCVEYPKNEWAACAWGSYPTMTPVSSITPIQLTACISSSETTYLTMTPVLFITPETTAIDKSSDHFLPVLCTGSIIGISAISIIPAVLKKKLVRK
ncbi:MAG: hypothetical protein ABFD51_08985 [Anaerolineaceae bacterium]